MNKHTLHLIIFLIFILTSSFGQVGKYRPFRLVIISPDTAVIDSNLKPYVDDFEERHLQDYNASINRIEDIMKKNHRNDSAFKRVYIEEDDELKKVLKEKKRSESKARQFKYYHFISEYVTEACTFEFNEFPPYSDIYSIPKHSLAHGKLMVLADSLKADYILGFKNIHTEQKLGSLVFKFTTILFSKKDNRIIFEKEAYEDLKWNMLNELQRKEALGYLLESAARIAFENTYGIIGKLQHFELSDLLPDDKGSYPVLNNTLNLLKEKSNLSEPALYLLLLNKIDSIFHLGLTVSGTVDSITLKYHSKRIILDNRKSFIRLCHNLMPEIKSVLVQHEFETDYDYYLADLLVFTFNHTSFLTSWDVGNYYNNRMEINIDRNGIFTMYDTCIDMDHNTINAGSILTEINHVPVKYYTLGTLKNTLFKKRNGSVNLKFQGDDGHGRNIGLKTYYSYKPNGLVYKLDKNWNCYINFNSYIKYKTSNTLHEFLTADCESIHNIIIDLRNTERGSIRETFEITNLFLQSDLELAELIIPGADTAKFISLNYNLCYKRRLFILVNNRTSGPAEIMARILKEYRGALVFGDKTMSNSKVQMPFLISNNYYINLLANFRIAKKYTLSKDPIIPDYSFESPVYESLNVENFK